MIPILGCSWLPLPPCLPIWSPFWAALGCRLVFQACLPSWSPFWSALGWRCRLVSQACLPSWSPFWAALGCRLVFQACPPSWSPFWAVLRCRCRLVSQACLSSWSRMVSSFLVLFLLISLIDPGPWVTDALTKESLKVCWGFWLGLVVCVIALRKDGLIQ